MMAAVETDREAVIVEILQNATKIDAYREREGLPDSGRILTRVLLRGTTDGLLQRLVEKQREIIRKNGL